jgi:hypothetical protein
VAQRRRSGWWKVPLLHPPGDPCGGVVRTYTYRHYPPDSPFFERCIGLAWCPACRMYTGAMVHVPRDTALPDPPVRNERRLLDHLNRLDARPPPDH